MGSYSNLHACKDCKSYISNGLFRGCCDLTDEKIGDPEVYRKWYDFREIEEENEEDEEE